jgi:hypothetical protein
MPFSGLAIYNNGVLNEIADDVSDMISMISPRETPLLDRLSQALTPAGHVLHEWLEDSLSPNTVTSSTAASTSGTAFAVHKAGTSVAARFQVGAVLKNNTNGEFMQVTAIAGNTLTVTRAFGGTTAGVLGAGDTIFFVSDAALEGADVTTDTSVARLRKSNYCQIFKKDIIVSGTMNAVTMLGNVGREYDTQLSRRMAESLRDLEKAVINGILSGNTIGTASNYRTMKGLWSFIATNSTSIATLTTSVLDDIIGQAWNEGGSDCNLIVADSTWKRVIDGFNSNRAALANTEMDDYRNMVTRYESTYGAFDVMLGRWMPTKSVMVISTDRVQVLPLSGRQFQHVRVAPTGDAEKGMILGEYTLQVQNEEGFAKAYG